MKTSIRGKVVAVTGAGGGIGREICKKMNELGAKIILLGGNNLDNLNQTASILEVEHKIIAGNLTDFDNLDKIAKEAQNAFGSIDILINNAGVAQNTPVEKVTMSEYDKIMNINAKAPYFLTQMLLDCIKKSDIPTIINVSSVVAKTGYKNQSVYSMSKHALLGFSESLAKETFSSGVRVHVICPGGVYTDMVKLSRPDLTPDGMIMPEDIADVIEFLVTHRTNAVIDEIGIHRKGKTPFSL